AILLPDFVDGADVGMIQRGSGARLTLETLKRGRVGTQFRREDLQGHAPAQGYVFGLIHHTHAAAAQLAQHAVVRNGLADHASLMLLCRSRFSCYWSRILRP